MDRPVQMFDLATLEQRQPRPRTCGGAIVPATRGTVQALARRHDVDFEASSVEALPEDGSHGEVRVACSYEVLSKMGVGGLVHLATCARCAGVERTIREALAKMAAGQQP